MIEYTDGHFGTIAPAKDIIELLDKLKTEAELENIKAVHFGTVDELDMVRRGKMDVDSIRSELDELKKEVETLKPKGKIKIYDLEDIPK